MPVVLLTGLLYDDRARAEAAAALAAARGRLPQLLRAAATDGLTAGGLADLADQVWPAALAGAARLPGGYVAGPDLDTAAAYLERYTAQRRSPADDLATMSPEDALDWATGVMEPGVEGLV